MVTTTLRTAVRDNHLASRFEVYVDGDVLGSLTYTLRGGEIWLLHTGINESTQPRLRRRLEALLVNATLQSVHSRRLQVLPFCPLVREQLRKQPNYLSLLTKAAREKHITVRVKGKRRSGQSRNVPAGTGVAAA